MITGTPVRSKVTARGALSHGPMRRSHGTNSHRRHPFRWALWLVSCALGLSGAATAAQQQPSPSDLPLSYRGGDIEQALNTRDWEQAERLLVATIERTPGSPALLQVLGSVFLIERKPLNAAIAIKKAEALAPLNTRSRFALVLAYISLKRGDWARPELERLAASEASNAIYLYWLGRLDYDAGRYDAAIKQFEAVVARDPDFVRAYDNLGLCYEALNQQEQALVQYRKALDLNRRAPAKSPWPALNLGILLRSRGETKEAEALVREAVRYDGGLAQAHYQLGVLLEQQGRLDDAVSELTRAVERDAAYAEPHYALARIYRRLGRASEARAALSAFQRLHDTKRPALPQ
jgi:tetratricopeptide (TPR) repeat protein